MQQIPDSSTSVLPDTTIVGDSAGSDSTLSISTKATLSHDSAAIQAVKAKYFYIQNLRKKEKSDSIRRAEDSLRSDSISKLIKGFEQQLSAEYSEQIPASSERFEGEPKSKGNLLTTGILVACIFIVAVLWSKYRKRINLLMRCMFNWKLGKQVIRYEQVFSHPVNIALLIVYAISVSVFVLHAFSPLHVHQSNLALAVLLCCAAFLTVYVLKIIFLFVIGSIFKIRDATMEYVFQILLILKFDGLLLIPILILLLYTDARMIVAIALGLAVLLVSFLFRIYRGFLIGLHLNERLLSIILYLCTLEILPALVIAKFIGDLYFS